MPKKPAALKAIVIDDAYALPTPATLRQYLKPLRTFLMRNPGSKTWFDATFGLTGKANVPAYFDPLLGSAEKRKLFWDKREKCPDPNYLIEAIADLVAEVAPKKAPLIAVEKELLGRGWSVASLSQLPAPEDVDSDLSLVVIDYVLQEEMPDDLVEKIKRSIEFLQALLLRYSNTGRSPLVVLISSLPSVKKKQAEEFKGEVRLQGAFFRFIPKSGIATKLGPYLDGFVRERDELDLFGKFHRDFATALEEGVRTLTKQIRALELQDLATLQVGQLRFEKESLGDYLAWMCGQVLTNKLQQNAMVAESSDKLPSKSYKVLLGHLEPTQGIPQLFTDLSSVRTASGKLSKQRNKKRALRFGDVFVGATPKNKTDPVPPKYYLVVSQTCDLLQEKLIHGQVLCVEGSAHEIEPTEAALLDATFKQMEDQGQIIKSDDKFLQIQWHPKQLVTLPLKALEKDKGFSYLGRLNEIYALEAQQDALQSLSRIGVPIKPGYGFFFSEACLRVFGSKTEVKALATTLRNETVLAAMRLDKSGTKSKYHLLLSADLRDWLVKEMNRLPAEATFPAELKGLAQGFIQWLADDDFRVICSGTKGVTPSREVPNGGATETKKIDKFELLLPQLSVFGAAPVTNGVRLSLELVRI
ncbi:hypothetical protein P2B00_04525 [Xanthomonas perforans]